MPPFLQDQVRVRGKCLIINIELTVECTLVPIVWHCVGGAYSTWEPLCILQAHCPQEQTLPFPWFQSPNPDCVHVLAMNTRTIWPLCAHNFSLAVLSFQHPYPTEDEKRQIAAQTNLTLLQVNNW